MFQHLAEKTHVVLGMKLHSTVFSNILPSLSGFIRRYQRFLLPIGLVVAARIVGSVLLFNILRMDSTQSYWMTVNWDVTMQNAVLKSLGSQGVRWPFLYLGWDSAWYLTITTRGYVFLDQSYAFFPGLPLFTQLVSLGLHDPALSLIVVSSIAGALWVPVFQLVAESYADASRSLRATIFYVFFPYVFLFTTVAYSEGLFMLFTLLSWYFFRKRAILPSMLFLAVAVLSRPPGLLLMLPILAMIIHSKMTLGKSLSSRLSYLWLLLPFGSFFLWLYYSKITIGSWFAIGTRTAWNGMPSFINLVFQALQGKGFTSLYLETVYQWPYSVAWALFLLAIPIMLYLVFKLDKWLGLYSAVFLIPVLVSGGILSLPRFVSFIFPFWLALGLKVFKNDKSKYAVPVIAVLSIFVGMLLWLAFIQGEFIA